MKPTATRQKKSRIDARPANILKALRLFQPESADAAKVPGQLAGQFNEEE